MTDGNLRIREELFNCNGWLILDFDLDNETHSGSYIVEQIFAQIMGWA